MDNTDEKNGVICKLRRGFRPKKIKWKSKNGIIDSITKITNYIKIIILSIFPW